MTGRLNGVLVMENIAELPAHEGGDDDFAHEVSQICANSALREFLRQRSQEPDTYGLGEVREKLGLD